jgi:hypothetical protein
MFNGYNVRGSDLVRTILGRKRAPLLSTPSRKSGDVLRREAFGVRRIPPLWTVDYFRERGNAPHSKRFAPQYVTGLTAADT